MEAANHNKTCCLIVTRVWHLPQDPCTKRWPIDGGIQTISSINPLLLSRQCSPDSCQLGLPNKRPSKLLGKFGYALKSDEALDVIGCHCFCSLFERTTWPSRMVSFATPTFVGWSRDRASQWLQFLEVMNSGLIQSILVVIRTLSKVYISKPYTQSLNRRTWWFYELSATLGDLTMEDPTRWQSWWPAMAFITRNHC